TEVYPWLFSTFRLRRTASGLPLPTSFNIQRSADRTGPATRARSSLLSSSLPGAVVQITIFRSVSLAPEDVAVHGNLADVGTPYGLAVLGMPADSAFVPTPREARVAADGVADQPGRLTAGGL